MSSGSSDLHSWLKSCDYQTFPLTHVQTCTKWVHMKIRIAHGESFTNLCYPSICAGAINHPEKTIIAAVTIHLSDDIINVHTGTSQVNLRFKFTSLRCQVFSSCIVTWSATRGIDGLIYWSGDQKFAVWRPTTTKLPLLASVDKICCKSLWINVSTICWKYKCKIKR